MPKSAVIPGLKRLWAARHRRLGHYTRETLEAFFDAWRVKPSTQNLLAWLNFRRDLGWRIPRRFVPVLRSSLKHMDAAERRQALCLLSEVDTGALLGLDETWLKEAGSSIPRLTAQIDIRHPMAQMALRQEDWQRTFATEFGKAVCDVGIQVVGNAATLQGQGLGRRIDDAAWVVRFNQFATGSEWKKDVGERLDVWVVSPGYRGPVPRTVGWVVVSGPDMLFRLQDWGLLQAFIERGTPVLSIPLYVWRWCVKALNAPPSAGVLMLYWLHCLNTDRHWLGLRSAGIGGGTTQRLQRYHLNLARQRAGHRHAWESEKRLVQLWESAGLETFGLTMQRNTPHG